MAVYPQVLEDLIGEFCRLPGIGRRTAERMAFYILESSGDYAKNLARLIVEVKKMIKPCRLCNNFSLEDVCSVCRDPSRNRKIVCVVEHPQDVFSIEKSGVFKGVYYVLLGGIEPLEGRGPEQVNLRNLENRLEKNEIEEIIIATGSDSQGRATAVFLRDKLAKYRVRIYRIGLGLPLGRQIEHTDSATLKEAFLERKSFF